MLMSTEPRKAPAEVELDEQGVERHARRISCIARYGDCGDRDVQSRHFPRCPGDSGSWFDFGSRGATYRLAIGLVVDLGYDAHRCTCPVRPGKIGGGISRQAERPEIDVISEKVTPDRVVQFRTSSFVRRMISVAFSSRNALWRMESKMILDPLGAFAGLDESGAFLKMRRTRS